MMRRLYIRSYGAFGAQSRYRIKPMATPKACADSQGGGQILHLIEDDRDGACHADLIGLGVVSLGAGFLQFVL